MYATIEDVKEITGDKYSDEKIGYALEYTEDDITSEIGDVNFGIKTETISSCNMYDSRLYLKNIQVVKILEINGKEYIDKFQILPPQNRCVMLTNIGNYINADNIQVLTIKYTSGYETLPSDIILAHVSLAISMLSSGSGGSISKYRMGPRSVEYASEVDIYTDRAKKLLGRYKILRI